MIQPGLFRRVVPPGTRQLNKVAKVCAVAGVTPFLLMGFLGVRINASPSLPLGIYSITDNADAPLIEFCPAEPYGSFAAIRGYRSEGSCSDGATPFLKPVVARGGDIVSISAKGIAVNGNLIPHSAPLEEDTQHRPMTPWPFGRYEVANGTVWVASSYNDRSFDSRYFGPVAISSIRNHLRPLVTFP